MLRSSTRYPRSPAICITVSRVMPGRMEVETGGDVAVVREHDRLVVARAARLVRGEHRVQVDAGRLRDVRDRIRPDALPGRDHRPDARGLALLAEVGAPWVGHDHDLDRVRPRVHA